MLADPKALPRALGEYLSEPKANVWFEPGPTYAGGEVHLDRRSRMLFDAARQVTGQAQACQIEGARRLQTLNIGGSCATVVSFVVERG